LVTPGVGTPTPRLGGGLPHFRAVTVASGPGSGVDVGPGQVHLRVRWAGLSLPGEGNRSSRGLTGRGCRMVRGIPRVVRRKDRRAGKVLTSTQEPLELSSVAAATREARAPSRAVQATRAAVSAATSTPAHGAARLAGPRARRTATQTMWAMRATPAMQRAWRRQRTAVRRGLRKQ
jgi:hypothetical protein